MVLGQFRILVQRSGSKYLLKSEIRNLLRVKKDVKMSKNGNQSIALVEFAKSLY